ncbi:MAG: GNAT family N-acetyltransferase [Hydrogenophilales bacterium]|nr:GNAT family N-acetyltransferase [Hydrogenophilales bacterium]
MNIDFASSEHAEQIAALHAASWAATYSDVLSPYYLEHVVPTERLAIWQERFENPKTNQCVLVAKEAGEVIAFACAFAGEHSDWGSYLDNLHVKQSHQGRGVGSSLLMQVAAICEKKCSGQGLYLSVNQSNLRAQNFYFALGAQNSQAAVWNAPDGTSVPTFRFSWSSATALAENAANQLFKRDALKRAP